MKTLSRCWILWLGVLLIVACTTTGQKITTPLPTIPVSTNTVEVVASPTPRVVQPSVTPPPMIAATPTLEVFNPAPIETVLADKSRSDLSSRLGMDLAMISTVEVSSQEWPDSCLGLPPVNNLECTKVPVGGWRVVLNATGHTHEYRADADGSLVAYAGPVIVAGPVACRLSGISMVYSPEDGYCFAYPVRFHRIDEHGPVAIYGPSYGPGPEPVSTSLIVEISLSPQGQTLEGAVDAFLAQLGDLPKPDTRQSLTVGGEPAIILEVVPGTPGSRDVFVAHNKLLFHLIFSPAPSVVPETSADVQDLSQTVISSLSFQP